MRIYRPKRYFAIKKFTKSFENAFNQMLENDEYNRVTQTIELDNGLIVRIVIEIDENDWDKKENE